jgi:hypothetical protein
MEAEMSGPTQSRNSVGAMVTAAAMGEGEARAGRATEEERGL